MFSKSNYNSQFPCSALLFSPEVLGSLESGGGKSICSAFPGAQLFQLAAFCLSEISLAQGLIYCPMCSLGCFSTGNLYPPTAQSLPVWSCCFSLVTEKGSILLMCKKESFYNFLYHKMSFYNLDFFYERPLDNISHDSTVSHLCCFCPVFIKGTTFNHVFSCDYNLLFSCNSDFQQSCGLFKPAPWSCKA